MPVFGFSKQRLNPDTAFAIRFLVGFGPMIGSDLIQDLLIHTAAKTASLLARGTLGFERAGIAIPGIGPIAP
jgi:hypothetical protein